MINAQETTLVVLTADTLDARVASALQSAARALGHADGCRIVLLPSTGDLRKFVYESDPWSVIAIDDASVDALRTSFGMDSSQFAHDVPAQAAGYIFVAVPDFASCLDDEDAKRVAWHRMKAAAHPGNPLG
jgi:hypothetical protein